MVLSFCSLLLALAALAAAPRADGANTDCAAWLARTARDVEKAPVLRRRDRILAALPRGCQAIAAPLKAAATRLKRTRDRSQRAHLLATAVQPLLGPGCPIADPLTDARKLASQCPLPDHPELAIDEEPLHDMRAIDYAVLYALQKSLQDAGEYGDSAVKVIRNFILSAALVGEQERKGN